MKYDPSEYQAGITTPISDGGRRRHLLVSELTEEEAKQELCGLLDYFEAFRARVTQISISLDDMYNFSKPRE